jgi:hypothetical protein
LEVLLLVAEKNTTRKYGKAEGESSSKNKNGVISCSNATRLRGVIL